MTPNQISFLVLALIAVLASVGVVAFGTNAVRSALFLVLNFFVLGFIYFTLGAQLLGITQIMVYAGAIMVLFLFVIMMLQLHHGSQIKKIRDPKPYLGLLVGLGVLWLVFNNVVVHLTATGDVGVRDDYGSPKAVGAILYSTYSWPFEVTSVLLLIGVVGSILLAKRRI